MAPAARSIIGGTLTRARKPRRNTGLRMTGMIPERSKTDVLHSSSGVMRRFRRHLSIVLFGWLFIQLSALAAPVVLAAAGAPSAEELCTCAGGDHETCPMHHGRSQSASTCNMHSRCAPTDVALLSIVAGTGVLPQIVSVAPVSVSASVPLAESQPLARAVLPDSPPPRF